MAGDGVGDGDGVVEVLLRRLDAGVPLPAYAHPGDAGADLCTREDVELAPGERRLVGTGVALALPEGYAGFVHPRSGLAARHGVSIVNAPGTLDAGYRGEVKVCLVNLDPRELIPLRLPQQAAVEEGGDEGEAPDEGAQEPGGARGRSRDDLQPVERGPEITEVR